jgi:hypothetical protein
MAGLALGFAPMVAAAQQPSARSDPQPTPLRGELPQDLRPFRERGVSPLEDRERVIFENSRELPPRLRGRTPDSNVTLDIVPSQRPNVADMRGSMRDLALADPRVRSAVGERFSLLGGGWLEPEKGQEAPPGGGRFQLLFYSYSRNRPVRVVASGNGIVEVTARTRGEQPAESREEVEAAADIVRSDARRREQVAGLAVQGLQTPAPRASKNRHLYVTFHRPGETGAVYEARVDMTAGRVVAFRPVRRQR